MADTKQGTPMTVLCSAPCMASWSVHGLGHPGRGADFCLLLLAPWPWAVLVNARDGSVPCEVRTETWFTWLSWH